MVVNKQIAGQPNRTVELLARVSYVAKALFYGSIATFIFRYRTGLSAPEPNRDEVLKQLTDNPFGKILIALIIVALAGHTLWRLYEIWNDPYKKGKGIGGWLYRLNYLMSAITYASLGVTAFKLLVTNEKGEEDGKKIWVAKLLQFQGGDWLVMLVGGVILIWAGMQVYKAVAGNVYKALKIDHLSGFWKVVLRVSSLAGFLTVGGILGGVGWYLIKGAWIEDPDWVKNMDDLIMALRAVPGGSWLQLVTAVGLVLMALFMLAMARYFPVKTAE
ncbi:DUF1206 domain-containing protein [Fibrisoma montanum]|uniref:DUF1206 domain-containing protein n=1 Tax=Fibrisoma montanum TaxID=2305895 RepID=A0A418MI31_9BACT|nr:DUF1206 domain-containing protein [Fibrisoma montanum]RIV26991.1 DUF1206 domain-containing protein [Fibrisoma montanum]